MKRLFCLIVMFVGFGVAIFGQFISGDIIGSKWKVIDTVCISNRIYKVSVIRNLYAYENTRDSLRFLPDNVDWRYLRDIYPVTGNDVPAIVADVLHCIRIFLLPIMIRL